MNRTVLITVIWIFWLCQSSLSAQPYNITEFGAVPDGTTLSTTAIQAAIDKAHADGGGMVIFPSGTYLSGTLFLKSNVELRLNKNATLLGSTNPDDYQKIDRWKALLIAKEQDNIIIQGKGVIDGQGRALALHLDSLFYIGQLDSVDYTMKEKRPAPWVRPQIIELTRCKNVVVRGVTLKNAACWVQTYDLCENLVFDHIRVESDAYWNNDGIDMIDCKNVVITHSRFNASDDGICLKSYSRNPEELCENIVISNCKVRSSASAVKLGTASFSGFRNIVIQDIKVYDTFRSAIAIEAPFRGIVENVRVDNVRAKNTGNALFIRSSQMKGHFPPGRIRNVQIGNMKVKVPLGRPDEDYDLRGPALPFFHNTIPSSITGIPGAPVENVRLENIRIIYPGRGNKGLAYMSLSRLDEVPEQNDKYPEFSMFGELPAWGLYCRHVEGLSMENVKVKIRKPDYRPGLIFDDVLGLKMEGVEVLGDGKVETVIFHGAK